MLNELRITQIIDRQSCFSYIITTIVLSESTFLCNLHDNFIARPQLREDCCVKKSPIVEEYESAKFTFKVYDINPLVTATLCKNHVRSNVITRQKQSNVFLITEVTYSCIILVKDNQQCMFITPELERELGTKDDCS